jgi:hypothetical protein
MPEKPGDVFYTSNKLYEIKVRIKDLDYTNDTVEVIFTSSLSTAYQIIDITFLIDPNDIIIEDIFGGEPIKLEIRLMREQDYPGPDISMDLLYLTSEFEMTEKNISSQTKIKDRTYFTITTLARKAYKTMSSLVNDVFLETTLSEVISSLASSVGATVNYDSDGQNTTAIDQVCIPPTTLYKIIKENDRNSPDIFDGYLDQRFGLFDGAAGVFCQHDNKVYIKNLTKKIQKDQTFTVYQLASGESSKQTQKIYDDVLGGKVFYTYDNITSSYSGNSKFGDLATTINHIVKPSNTITNTITQDLQTIAQNYSLLYSQKNKKLFIDAYANRTRYYNEDTGNNDSETLFNAMFGRSLSNLSLITINLERNLPVLNLIDVGECVKFKPRTIEYVDFEGKYVLWASQLSFIKEGPQWASTAQISLYRTNKKI